MRMLLFIVCLILFSNSLFAQNSFSAFIKDAKTNAPLIGANVYFVSLNIGGAANSKGFVRIINIPNGKYPLTVSYIGYKTETLELKFPHKNQSETITVLLKPEGVKSEEVIVTSTRTNGVVEDSPVKVEVLGQDEVNEEIAIRPGNVSKLLGETSGVIIQQTSGVSGVVSFRLEGLPGAYTQLLKDGLPLLNQFSSGLTLLQIPPLDLQQVEVVKGASSIFYGDGAVAGFVNIVTRKPSNKHEFDLVLNQTSRKGTDISSFYSNKFSKLGFTLLISLSRQSPVDIAGNGFTDIPKFNQATINPKLFWNLSKTTNIELGVNAFYEDRSGGDISAIENGPDSLHSFIERNKSNRFNTILKFNKSFSNGSELNFKNNIYYYNRDISISNNNFSGRQIYSFNELSYLTEIGNHKAVFGANFIVDNFRESADVSNSYSYNRTTFGFFAQDNWQLTPRLILQPGLRIDYNNIYNSALLPHLSMMYKISNSLNVRISVGSAYLTPSIFNYSDSRDLVKHNISFSKNVSMSKANSLNLDFGYKLIIDEFVFKVNQAFFYTNVKNAVIPNYLASESIPVLIDNSNSSLVTKGSDTNILIALDELELFADYSYADVKKTVNGITAPLELTPKNKLNLTLTYEEEDEWRAGLEAFYTGAQYLEDETYSRSYWLLGAMFDKMFKDFSVILNVEDILDERQSKYDKIVLPPYSDPTFSPLYMPIDGIVANIAVWIRLK